MEKVMKRLTRMVVVLAIVLSVPAIAFAQKLVYVVRHAERADGGAGTTSMSGAPADPSLSAAGEARAAKLAAMLADAGITAIYATEFKRTQETAKPLSARTGVAVATVAASATSALVSAIRAAHATGVVLVVAHSNTMPAIIKAFGGPDVVVGDNDYDGLFVVVPATGTLSKIRY
jgi:broad specificity phosphatase PhoE